MGATMKLIYSVFILFAEFKGIVALPASSIASATAGKPAPILSPPCQALCTKGSHFYDPDTKKCTCVPDSKEEQKCLLETICVEYDIPMVPVWDDGTKKCSCKSKKDVVSECLATTTCLVGSSPFLDPKTRKCTCTPNITEEQKCLQETICVEYDVPMFPVWDDVTGTCDCKPRSNEEFICIAATTCLPGSSPYWNATTKQCDCLKTKPTSEGAKRDSIPQEKPTKTISPTPTPSASIDTCTFLKVFCECGDHHMHWSEEKQGCECPACPPVVSLGCENLMIYCNEGNHHMHWDPISQKCQCPSAPSPTIVPGSCRSSTTILTSYLARSPRPMFHQHQLLFQKLTIALYLRYSVLVVTTIPTGTRNYNNAHVNHANHLQVLLNLLLKKRKKKSLFNMLHATWEGQTGLKLSLRNSKFI